MISENDQIAELLDHIQKLEVENLFLQNKQLILEASAVSSTNEDGTYAENLSLALIRQINKLKTDVEKEQKEKKEFVDRLLKVEKNEKELQEKLIEIKDKNYALKNKLEKYKEELDEQETHISALKSDIQAKQNRLNGLKNLESEFGEYDRHLTKIDEIKRLKQELEKLRQHYDRSQNENNRLVHAIDVLKNQLLKHGDQDNTIHVNKTYLENMKRERTELKDRVQELKKELQLARKNANTSMAQFRNAVKSYPLKSEASTSEYPRTSSNELPKPVPENLCESRKMCAKLVADRTKNPFLKNALEKLAVAGVPRNKERFITLMLKRGFTDNELLGDMWSEIESEIAKLNLHKEAHASNLDETALKTRLFEEISADLKPKFYKLLHEREKQLQQEFYSKFVLLRENSIQKNSNGKNTETSRMEVCMGEEPHQLETYNKLVSSETGMTITIVQNRDEERLVMLEDDATEVSREDGEILSIIDYPIESREPEILSTTEMNHVPTSQDSPLDSLEPELYACSEAKRLRMASEIQEIEVITLSDDD